MKLERTALILLASGRSRRFAEADKLLATLGGQPVLAHAGGALSGRQVGARLAVVGVDQTARREMLAALGWTLVDNSDPDAGQGASLALGARAAADRDIDALMVLLADMPGVPDAHLETLAQRLGGDADAILSRSEDISGPPAIFARPVMERLQALIGDEGARRALSGFAVETIYLSEAHARDVDTVEDLAAIEAAIRRRC